MSVSCSDQRFSDLLCCEESSVVSEESPEYSSDVEFPVSCSDEESIAGLIEEERNFVTGADYLARFRSHSFDAFSREESVAWILKVPISLTTNTVCFCDSARRERTAEYSRLHCLFC